MRYYAKYYLTVFLIFLFQGLIHAQTLNLNLNFDAPTQSMWGPNSASLDFRANGILGSTGTAGIGYDIGASSGTVQGSFNGMLGLDYTPYMSAPGTSSISMNFTGLTNGGIVSSALGAWIDFDAYLLGLKADVYDQNYSLQINAGFTPQIGSTISGSDSFSLYGVGTDIYFAGASVNLDLKQTDTFTAKSLNGAIQYNLRGTSLTRDASFILSNNGLLTLDANLDRSGIWDFSFNPFVLDNEFVTDFDLQLVAEAYYKTLDVPHWWEFWNAHFDTHSIEYALLGIDVYDADPFALAFNNDITRSNVFSVSVAEPVPEPSTFILFATGLVGVAIWRRKIYKK